ncbi:MAG: MFS transporter [Candidatus Micrarchaeota archaeon]|nr:MFS transporter [Candidatus Micrarchaeota archaeon]
MKETENSEASRTRWMYAEIPANIAIGPLSTLIPLYILKLGGGPLEVAYAISIYNAIGVPASLLWGHYTDSFKRKTIIIFSYLMTTVFILALMFSASIPEVIILYAALSFVITASSTPLNLLVTETSPKESWPKRFGFLQTLAGIGTVIGLLIGAVVTQVSDLNMFITILSLASLVSLFLSIVLIVEPRKVISRSDSFLSRFRGFMHVLFVEPIELAVSPIASIKNMVRNRRIGRLNTGHLTVFYIGTLIFYIGTGLFNTEYVAGLKLHGLLSSAIFVIILVSSSIQIFIFKLSYRYINDTKKNPIPSYILPVRALGWVLIGLSFMALTGSMFFYVNLVVNLIAAGIIYAIFYTGCYTVIFNALKSGRPGFKLGMYSVIIGVGTLTGAFLSGLMASSLGFVAVFFSAGALIALSGYVLSRF